ncbi:bifunctional adenosylcobinamide kinase/adenosylcobinamide-phosphate guanylyltransferase [Halomonas elongata]|uniref:bifunctional adenosylcobinamide kinase/adenosylcobinamide-phosphate guanylyltransferase n=1 Tax=Halomonas elongata TaxID=2746 RepID=UPI0038D42050
MQLFIGGARAGKRDLVASRFPEAVWSTAEEEPWREERPAGRTWVITGWRHWLETALAAESDDDRLRARFGERLEALYQAEAAHDIEWVLILPEMGRGIVPLEPRDRRLRDLAGWLAQDAAARADEVWYLRHGLASCLKRRRAARSAR